MEELAENSATKIIMTVDNSAEVEGDTSTRLFIDNAGKTVPTIYFTGKDSFGIFATTGTSSQISFATGLAEGDKQTTVNINAGAWNTKEEYMYVSYLPYSLTNTDPKKIPTSYLGQKQLGKSDCTHLNDAYFLASEPVTATNGAFGFNNKMMGTLMMFDITLPEAVTLNKLEISSSNASQFGVTGTFDLTDVSNASNKQPYTATKTSNAMTLDLNNISLEANETCRYYFYMPAPTDFTGSTLTFTLTSPSTGKKYVCSGAAATIFGTTGLNRARNGKGLVAITADKFTAEEDNSLGTLTGTVQ